MSQPVAPKSPLKRLPHPFHPSKRDGSAFITLPIEQRDCALCVTEANRQLKQLDDQLKHESRIADVLQRAALPAAMPTVDGLSIAYAYQAGDTEADIGGDFYDVFETSPGNVALVLGDVCGKGLAAAAQVSMLRNMLRYALYSRQDLQQAVSELNSVLIANSLLDAFATLFVAVVNTKSQTFEYVSCGHPAAMVVRRSLPNQIELLTQTGPILGVAIDAPIRSGRGTLSKGDSIVIYSDGLVECGPHRCELLGVSKVILAIRGRELDSSAEDIARQIYAASRQTTAGGGDDICLVVGQVTTDGTEQGSV